MHAAPRIAIGLAGGLLVGAAIWMGTMPGLVWYSLVAALLAGGAFTVAAFATPPSGEMSAADASRAKHVALPRLQNAALSGSTATIAALTAGIREVSQGDFTKNLAVTDGPLSELGIALNKLIFSTRDFLAAMKESVERLAVAGTELSESADDSLAIIDGSSVAQRQLEEGILEQSTIVVAVQAKITSLTDAIVTIAGSAEQQTRTLDETALSVTAMSSSIEEVAEQVDSLLTISSETSLTADRGGSAIHTIVGSFDTIRATIGELANDIRQLGDNSSQIGDIVKVIDRIAEQTNLLALNAAIEAARAGEHGRGFAVVASEIRKLADGSVAATKEIAGYIGSTQGVIAEVTHAMQRLTQRVEESVSSTDNASLALREIVEAVLKSNNQITQISNVTRSMSQNSVSVIRAIDEITRSVAANLAATQQMAAHSNEVSTAFEGIAGISGQNASSVEVLSYVNTEVTAASQRILSSVEEMNAQATAITGELGRYRIADPAHEGTSL
jgi:methyl-accepting chemotaxis protein